MGRSKYNSGYLARLKNSNIDETNQNFLPLFLGLSKSLALHVLNSNFCFGVRHKSAAGTQMIIEAITKKEIAIEKPK